MKRFFPFFLFTIVFTYCFYAASCESKTDQRPCLDTLSIDAGKANHIIFSNPKTGKVLSSVILIEDSTGKILAFKNKEGWEIVDAGKALEVLIADLEICKQSK